MCNRWVKRVDFWMKRVEKKNPSSKAVERLKRRAEAADKLKIFSADTKAWIFAMIRSYTAQNPEDPEYKQYYPTVETLRNKVVVYDRERQKYYFDQMSSKDKRGKVYRCKGKGKGFTSTKVLAC